MKVTMMNQLKSRTKKNRILLVIFLVSLLLVMAISVQAGSGERVLPRGNLQSVESGSIIFISSSSSGRVGGITFDDEDIIAYDEATGQWSRFFDGSRFGLGGNYNLDVDAFHVLEDNSILLSTRGYGYLPAIGNFDDSDILLVRPQETVDSFELFLDGQSVGLEARGEDIDGITLLSNGDLLVSTLGSFSTGRVSGEDEDLIRIRRNAAGVFTANGTSLYLDGSMVGLDDSSSEDVYGLAVEADDDVVYMTTRGKFAVGNINGESYDIFQCQRLDTSRCNFGLRWQGAAFGIGKEYLDGISLRSHAGKNSPPPTATNTPPPAATNTPQPTATNTPPPTVTNTPPPTATNTPLPTATNTPLPTATNTPPPAATNTPLPTATNTPPPTATNTPSPPPPDGLSISQVTDNRASYADGRVPTYEKFEITFRVNNSVAGNLQLPYDPNPPFGIDPQNYPRHRGISVDAYFLPPGQSDWGKAYAQPGFFYRNYAYDVRDSRDWIYPLGDSWKIRFAPDAAGEWQYKLRVQDASGVFETSPASFVVNSSNNKGFVKVSQRDPRYFEYDDGSLFYHMGINSKARFDDPVIDNTSHLRNLGQNGSRLTRIWISGIYGAAWPEFLGVHNVYDGYLPRAHLLPFKNQADGKESITVRIDQEIDGDIGWFPNCVWQFWNDPESVKPHTNYRIRVKYRATDISGPRNAQFPNYGLVLKTGGNWTDACLYPDRGTALTAYGQNNNDWRFLETTWNSGSSNWLTKLYLVLENVNEGKVYLDSITVQEDLGNGQFGPNIMVEGDFQYDLVYPESQTWALDQIVRLAEENDVYLQMVIGDKSDRMWWKIDNDGTYVIDGESDNQTGYYGNWYNLSTNGTNRTRWLQRAWWRYLQARYGYSPNVFAWEFTNEGDPNNGKHWSATDLLGRYMKCEVFGVSTPDTNGDGLPVEGDKCEYDHPNAHLVSTSFWHSFPAYYFWGSSDWPNVDYADLHTYSKDLNYLLDTAQYHLYYSTSMRDQLDSVSALNGMPTKPIIRGEVGIPDMNDLLLDTRGVWLHNFTWAALDPGAMYELFWELRNEISRPVGPDGQPGLYEIYKYFGDFISNIPLNNGYYQDAAASLTDGNLRVTGQKDLVNDRAHLWIQNKNHTWRRVVDNNAQTGLSGTVTISGFDANKTLPVQWHQFTTQGIPTIVNSTAVTDGAGNLTLNLPSNPDIADVALKIGSY
jgi:hypothetical protein